MLGWLGVLLLFIAIFLSGTWKWVFGLGGIGLIAYSIFRRFMGTTKKVVQEAAPYAAKYAPYALALI